MNTFKSTNSLTVSQKKDLYQFRQAKMQFDVPEFSERILQYLIWGKLMEIAIILTKHILQIIIPMEQQSLQNLMEESDCMYSEFL